MKIVMWILHALRWLGCNIVSLIFKGLSKVCQLICNGFSWIENYFAGVMIWWASLGEFPYNDFIKENEDINDGIDFERDVNGEIIDNKKEEECPAGLGLVEFSDNGCSESGADSCDKCDLNEVQDKPKKKKKKVSKKNKKNSIGD
jgi:hypothetical protein